MIWFNLKELEEKLINGTVDDKLALMYLLSHLIFISASSHLGNYEDPYWSVLAHLTISLFFTIWGVRKTFEINRRGGNVDFFKRFLSLSFVTGVRLFVFAVAVLFFFNLVSEVLVAGFGVQLPFAGYAPVFELVFYAVLMGSYYYLLLNSFKRVNGAQLA